MARKIIAVDEPDRFGILVTYSDGQSGWIAGTDNGYMLFPTEKEANKALRKLKRNDNYSWNCNIKVARFQK